MIVECHAGTLVTSGARFLDGFSCAKRGVDRASLGLYEGHKRCQGHPLLSNSSRHWKLSGE